MESYSKNDYNLDIEAILNPNFKWHGDLYKFFKLVVDTGYPYFSWNGWIYKVNDYQEGYEKLNVTIEDIRNKYLITP